MNKQHLSYFAAILILFLILAPAIAGAGATNQSEVPNMYMNVTVDEAKKILEDKDVFLLDVLLLNTITVILKEQN